MVLLVHVEDLLNPYESFLRNPIDLFDAFPATVANRIMYCSLSTLARLRCLKVGHVQDCPSTLIGFQQNSLRHETATLTYVADHLRNPQIEFFDGLIWAISRIALTNVLHAALISC